MAEIRTGKPTPAADRTGEPISLRWVLATVFVEYSRHNGHADLPHERINGNWPVASSGSDYEAGSLFGGAAPAKSCKAGRAG